MAQIKTEGLVQFITGKIDKGSKMVSRVKKYRDPITGEVIGYGPNEYYVLSKPNCPFTENQKRYQRKFQIAATTANEIVNNRMHPRFDELYARYIDQFHSEKPIKHFQNFVCSIIYNEL